MENIDLFKLEYKYTQGSLKKLQELHRDKKLNFERDKDFNRDLVTAISKDVDIAICVLWASQTNTKHTLEQMYEIMYEMPVSVAESLKRVAYYVVNWSYDPVGFVKAHIERAKQLKQKQQENIL